MYISYGRAKGAPDTLSDKYFHVVNCGIYRNVTYKVYTNRANGRNDYQIIYVMDGIIEIETKSGWKKVGKGNFIVFEPKVPQHYFAVPDINTSYCWIHFNGTQVGKMVAELNIKSGIYDVGECSNFVARCLEIITAMKKKDETLEYKISGLAMANLVEFYEKRLPKPNKKFEEIVTLMENDSPNGTPIDEYAKLCNFSRVHFSRLFKAEYGMSPTNYRLKLLIDKSKPLLSESNLKIREVALTCGFDDPLYFSRAFKKLTGLSPEKYRKKYK